MAQDNGDLASKTSLKKVKTREVISGLQVIEMEYRVQRPVFEDIKIERPVYVDKEVNVPTGIEKLVNPVAELVASQIMSHITKLVDKKLAEAINTRIEEIRVPKINYVEQEKVVERPIFKDVEVERPRYIDKMILNPILEDKKVINAVIEDKQVTNAIINEVTVLKPKFEEVKVSKPVFVEKEVPVIHLKYLDLQGNEEKNP